MNEDNVKKALINIINAVAKMDYAPFSASTNLNTAIALLLDCLPEFLANGEDADIVTFAIGENIAYPNFSLPKFCTIKNMNFEGDLIHGELKNEKTPITSYYLLDDGDCYRFENLKQFDVTFSNNNPRIKV